MVGIPDLKIEAQKRRPLDKNHTRQGWEGTIAYMQINTVLNGATIKAGMTERRNGGILKHRIAESWNGGKYTQILKHGIAESRNGRKSPQILKDGTTENHPKS